MKKFFFLAAFIAGFTLILASCTEDSPTTSEVAYNEITPFYPDGGGSGGGGETTTGGSTGGEGTGGSTGGSTGGDPEITDPEVILMVKHGKYCSWATAGQDSVCARTEKEIADPNAKTYCWGSDYYGFTAVPRFEKDDSRYGQSTMSAVTDISSVFASVPTQMDAGPYALAATLASGKGDVIGSDATINDEIGSMSGHLSTRNGSPLKNMPDNTTVFKAVSGQKHTGFLLSDGRYTAVGTGTHGQLGVENRYRVLNKVTYFAPDSEAGQTWTDVRDVAAGSYHTCVTRGEKNKAGSVWCVGKNSKGQLGHTGVETSAEWHEVGITDAVQVAASSNESCALHENGDVSCWGGGDNGIVAMGDDYRVDAEGNLTLKHPPTKITQYKEKDGTLKAMPPLRAISMGTAVAFGITHDNVLMAWGSNGQGHTGTNQPSVDYLTRPMSTGLSNVTDVAIHNTTVIARIGKGAEAKFYAAGKNDKGQATGGANTTANIHEWYEIVLPAVE